jgi:tetratricopeptide (TPR) repeat protein
VAAALAEESASRWEAALDHMRQAERLDPRSVSTARRLGTTLAWLRRYAEALPAYDHGLAVAPANLGLLEGKAMVSLGQGDLAGARAVLRAAPKDVEPTVLVAFVATFWDLMWVLDDAQQALLVRLTPSAFDGDRGTWGIVLAQTYALRGDQTRAQLYADSARIAVEQHLRATPQDAQQHAFLGLALAYLGRKAEAVREGERGVALSPVPKDAYGGPYIQHLLARIYLVVGEPEKALDQVEPLLKMPYFLSPGWLRIDPNFARLRGNPRFERLVAQQ